jgi:hypothetical protein
VVHRHQRCTVLHGRKTAGSRQGRGGWVSHH